MRNTFSMAVLFALSVSLVACSGVGAEGEEELGDEAAALTSRLSAGTRAVTTTRLRLREEASTDSRIIRVLDAGTQVTLVDGQPDSSFYKVKLASGQQGYCHGAYLTQAGGGATEPDATDPGSGTGTAFPTSGDIFRSRGTGYYPDDSPMEGGFVDRQGARLRTLQDYLAGRAEYVSVAMDTSAFRYGQKLRIKEFEARYGRNIEFRVVDTGGAFQGRGRSRIDICVKNASASVDATVNSMLTIAVVR